MTQTTTRTPLGDPGAPLGERAMLVHLTVHQWRPVVKDREITREVNTARGIDDDDGQYRKRLASKESTKAVRSAADALYEEHRRRTRALGDNGDRVLSTSGYFDYVAAVRALIATFDACADAFVADWDAVIDEAAVRLNGGFRRSDYPTAAQVRAAFSVDVDVMPLATAGDFRADLGEAETARVTQQVADRVTAKLAAGNREIAQRIQEVVGNMVERLTVYRKEEGKRAEGDFRDSLVGNVRALVDVLPSLNIMGDPALAAIADRMRDELCAVSADGLKESERARVQTREAAEAVLAAVSDWAA